MLGRVAIGDEHYSRGIVSFVAIERKWRSLLHVTSFTVLKRATFFDGASNRRQLILLSLLNGWKSTMMCAPDGSLI